MVSVSMAVAAAHPPAGAMVLVIVYVPGADAPNAISPVFTSMDKPDGDAEKRPALAPDGNAGTGSGSEEQNDGG